MRKVVASLTIGLVLALGFPGSAWAKGPESVTISGGDLDKAIVVPLSGSGSDGKDAPPPYLVAALDALADPFHVARETNVATSSPIGVPAEDLDHYTLTWDMFGEGTIVQDIYPNLGTGPVIHTHPSAYLDSKSGWYEAPESLRATLAALGAPITGLPTGLPTTKVTVSRPAPTDADGAPLWTLPAVATAALAVGAAFGFAARRLTHRPRPTPELVLGSS